MARSGARPLRLDPEVAERAAVTLRVEREEAVGALMGVGADEEVDQEALGFPHAEARRRADAA
jgi:hypothetical protein